MQPDEICFIRFPSTKKLAVHLQQGHGIKFHTKELKFSTFEKFKVWKEEEEEKTTSHYVQHSSTKNVSQGTVTYFICN